jgi:TldD protein
MEKFLAEIIDLLKLKGVDYGDARVVETQTESIVVKNGIVEGITKSVDTGFGVRVLKDRAWGFASTSKLGKREQERTVRDALTIAHASARIPGKPVTLAPLSPQRGTYKTAIVQDPFAVGLETKIDLLLACDKILRQKPDIKIAIASLSFTRIKKYFASTEGSSIEQEIHESGGGISCYAIKNGEMQERSYPCGAGGNFAQAGYEFIERLKFLDNAEKIREEACALLTAPTCPEKETTLILGSNQMVLQVHESIGHPTELDRVLGTEESYAGTSFVNLEKLNNFQYGSEFVTIYADATVPGGLGSFGFDDEGVPAQKTALVKNGQFTGYLTSRETAPIVGQVSNGTMRADGWQRIPLIRMTNINIEPGSWKLADLIGDTDDGIFMETNKSWSIDNKRLNFQFGTEIAWRIDKGKLTEMYKNPIYFGITPEFWRSCDGVGNRDHWLMWGVPNCGKGEPGQTAHVGHGTAPARFRNIRVAGAKT